MPKVNTLKLVAGALKENDCPVLIELVTGTAALGVDGELLAVAAPVRVCAVPIVEMPENGRLKVTVWALVATLTTCLKKSELDFL